MPKDEEPRTISESHKLQGTRESMDFVQRSILDTMESFGYKEDDLLR
jgi:hypothetical protein